MIHTILLSMFLLQSLSEQKFCADAARQYVRDEYKPDRDQVVTYTTHYNKTLNVCLARIDERFTVGTGNDAIKTYPLGALTITVVDVVQRDMYAIYTRMPMDVGLGRQAYIKCGDAKEVVLFLKADYSSGSGGLVPCNETIDVFETADEWTRVRTKDNREGYISSVFLSYLNGKLGKVLRCEYLDNSKSIKCGQIEPEEFRKRVAPLMAE